MPNARNIGMIHSVEYLVSNYLNIIKNIDHFGSDKDKVPTNLILMIFPNLSIGFCSQLGGL